MTNQSGNKTPVSPPEKSEIEGDSLNVVLEQPDSEIVVETHTPDAKPEPNETTSTNPVIPLTDVDAEVDVLGIADSVDAESPNATEALPLDGPNVAHAHSSQSTAEPTVQVLQLENAMAGRSYATSVDLAKLPFNVSGIDRGIQTEFAALGLTISMGADDKPSLRVEGKLSQDTQGDHTFDWDVNDGKDSSARLQLRLLVNADPKSLWRNLEPASDLPYAKPHTATAYLEGKGYKIIAASRRGRSHAHEGTFRDDDFSVVITDFGWDILIVADGAGSAKCSREGSRIACSTAAIFLQEKIPQLLGVDFLALLDGGDMHRSEINTALYQVLCGAAFAAYKKIDEEAKTTGRNLKEYSTTFLCSIVRRMKQGIFVASFGIGDGAIGVYNGKTNEVELMNSPDGGDFSGQTRFLTMTELVGDGTEMMRRIKYKVFEEFTAMFLMTDGISDPKFGTDNSLLSPEKWQALGEDLLTYVDFSATNKKAADQLCEWTDFWAQGEHDDRTLAIMY